MINTDRLDFLKNRNGRVKKTRIKIPSDAAYIGKASSKILNALKGYALGEARIFDIKLCVEEAVRNAMVHGNRSDRSLPVRVTYWIKDDKLTIEVEDKGKGFDHYNVPDPTARENVTRNSGRGVYLIKNLMDEVEYNDIGNRVRMVSYLGRGARP